VQLYYGHSRRALIEADGWTLEEGTRPERILDTPLPGDPAAVLTRERLRPLVAEYPRQRDWQMTEEMTGRRRSPRPGERWARHCRQVPSGLREFLLEPAHAPRLRGEVAEQAGLTPQRRAEHPSRDA
jgi:hypothetical protein